MVVDGRFMNSEAAVDKVIKFYHKREEIKTILQGKVDFAKNQIKKNFERIILEAS